MMYNKVVITGSVCEVTARNKVTIVRIFNANPRSETEKLFIDVKFFDKLAETTATHIKKGSKVLIDGRLVSEEWEKDGEKRRAMAIVADTFQFIGGKPAESEVESPEEELVASLASSEDLF